MILEIVVIGKDDPEEDRARFYCDPSCTYSDVCKGILAQIELCVDKSSTLLNILQKLEWTSDRKIKTSDGWRYSEVCWNIDDHLYKGYMYKITDDEPF